MKSWKPIILLFFVLAAGTVSLGFQHKDERLCPLCKTTGKVVNPFYEANQHLEEGIRFCSWSIEKDRKGRGIPWLPCDRCRRPDLKAKATAEFEKEAAIRLEWLSKRREIDETLKMRQPLLHLETQHFKWAWNIPKFTVDKKVYRMHEALHLYAERMEEFYAEFQRIHRISDPNNCNSQHELYCFERQIAASKACGLYGGQASPNGKVTWQGHPEHSTFVTWLNKSEMPSDGDFHRDMIHNVSHLLTAAYNRGWWLFAVGFAHEGSAHWWEMYYYKKATSYCFQENNSMASWVSTKWEAKVKKALMAGKVPSFADMILKPTDGLDEKDHVYAWSYVDYLMHLDPHKAISFYDLLKQKKPVREALLQVFDMSVLGFEEKWKVYVMENYSLKEDDVPDKKRAKW
jgi:hypothetical protein